MGDMADLFSDYAEQSAFQWALFKAENEKLTDLELVEALEDSPESHAMIRSICGFYRARGFITKKQRYVLINFLTDLDEAFA